MRSVNLFDDALSLEPGASRPEGFRRHHRQIGRLIGASRIGATLYELPPGERLSPYHYHHGDEEWLIVLEGRPTLRTPDGERELRPGEVVAFADGPAGAHATSNRTDARVRVLMLSTKEPPAVAVYPDSDKIAIWRVDEADAVILRRSGAVDYWNGEA
jgi:uncharacterized cupin superfamily protein